MRITALFIAIFCLEVQLLASDYQSGWVVAWGYNGAGNVTGYPPVAYTNNTEITMRQLNDPKVPWYTTGAVMVAGEMLGNIKSINVCGFHTVALKNDGNFVAWGLDGWGTNRGSEFIPPCNLNDLTVIVPGEMHFLGIKKDGSVIAWGEKKYGATNVPQGLSNVVAVAACCGDNSLALRSDGTLVSWGQSISIPNWVTNIVAVSADPCIRQGIGFQGEALALRKDGRVIDIGWNTSHSRAVIVDGVSNVAAIYAAPVHNLALRKDGTVYCWGYNGTGELDQPKGLTNVVAIAASGSYFPADGYSLVLKGDGTLAAWGQMNYHPITVPEGLSNVVAIAVNGGDCFAVTTNRLVAERFLQMNTPPR